MTHSLTFRSMNKRDTFLDLYCPKIPLPAFHGDKTGINQSDFSSPQIAMRPVSSPYFPYIKSLECVEANTR